MVSLWYDGAGWHLLSQRQDSVAALKTSSTTISPMA